MRVIEIPAEGFTHRAYELHGGKLIATVGVTDTNLLSRGIYVWLELHARPTWAELKEMRRLWQSYAAQWGEIVVAVCDSSAVNRRFAEAFGFSGGPMMDKEHRYYGLHRPVHTLDNCGSERR